ncbi:AEC family transporter [Candidatus Uhrbacteria bacterium]|nr:AEC family transporter [Candidatus Uhrbacteria bacterium]
MLAAILGAIIPTFGFVGIGWFCRRVGVWGRDAVHVLNSYAYYIALPALIFDAVFKIDFLSTATTQDLRYLLGLLLGHVIVAAIAVIATWHAPRPIRAVAPMLLTFGSTAYLGIPFATFAFGAAGTAYAAIGSVVVVVAMLFIALTTLNAFSQRTHHTATWQQLLELPFLWVVLAGLFLPILGIKSLPDALAHPIEILAGSAGPTSLLALGAFDFDLQWKRIPWRWSLPFGIGKVILCSVATFFALKFFGVTGLPLAVGTTLAATSIAVTAFVLSEEYRTSTNVTDGAIAASSMTALLCLSLILALWVGTGVFQ